MSPSKADIENISSTPKPDQLCFYVYPSIVSLQVWKELVHCEGDIMQSRQFHTDTYANRMTINNMFHYFW